MASDRYNDILVCVSPTIFKMLMKEEQYSGYTLGIAVRSESDADKLQEMVKEIFSLQNGRMCLWIDEKLYRRYEQKISELMMLLYSTNYLFSYNKPIIYFINSHSEHYNNSRESFFNLVSSFGFTPCVKEVESWALSSVWDHQWFLQAGNGLSREELSSFYFDLLTQNFFVDRSINIFSSGERNIRETLETIIETEKAVFKSNPGLHELFLHYRFIAKEHERLSNEKNQLKTDLINQKKYLAVLRNEKEMEKIIEFYHREYEVLPLWYKRFGHIIKIFTGKRKIRSTFNQR